MKREIKFKVWDKTKEVFIPTEFYAVVNTSFKSFGIMLKDWEDYKEGEYFYSNAQELSQFTGLHDKNGKEIYEGDIVKYFTLKNYRQQSHEDVSPEIDTYYIKCICDYVVYKSGAFVLSEQVGDVVFCTLNENGLDDLVYIKEMCNCVDDETTDCNGNEINETILGIEIIGNIYENPELLNN